MNFPKMSRKVLSSWNKLKNKSPDINYFISTLEQISNKEVGIFGGAARDWVLDRTPKDIDLVIEASEKDLENLLDNFGAKKNGFDGNVLNINGVSFDFWLLKDTYSFRTGQYQSNWENLVWSVPFSTDSILVKLSGRVYTHSFISAISDKEIGFVNRKIRNPKRIAARAQEHANRYGFKLSPELCKYVKAHTSIKDKSSNSDKIEFELVESTYKGSSNG